MAAVVRTIRLNVDGSDLRKAAKEANYHLKNIETQARKTRVSMNRIMGMGAIMFYSTAARRVANFSIELATSAEKITLLGKRMRTLTKETDALDKIVMSANEVGVSFDELSKVVGRFAVATRNSFQTEDMIKWTEGIIKSGRLVGNTQKEIQSGLTQLSQGLSAGRLMGDEFRSVMENLPLLAIEIRKQFEGDTRALKELSSQGLLTAEVVVNAMEQLNENMEGIPGLTDTVAAKLSRMGNAWDIMLKEMMSGTNNWITNTIEGVTWLMDKITSILHVDDPTARIELFSDKELLEDYENGLKSVQATLVTISQAGAEAYGSQEAFEKALTAVGRTASEYQTRIDALIIRIDNWNGETQEQIKLKKELKDLTDINKENEEYKLNKKALELADKANLAGDKKLRIAAKWDKYRSSIKDMLMNEITSSKSLVALNDALTNSYAAQQVEMDKLLGTKKEVKELGECDSIQQEISCIDELINKYNPLADAVTKRNIALNEQSWLLQRGAIDETAYAKAVSLIDDEFRSATTEADKFTEATKKITREADPFYTAWENAFKRLDDAGVEMWENLFDGAKNSLDSIKDLLKSWLAEMAHALTTKPLMMSIQAGVLGMGASGSAMAGGFNVAGGMDLLSMGNTIWEGFNSGFSAFGSSGGFSSTITSSLNNMIGGGALGSFATGMGASFAGVGGSLAAGSSLMAGGIGAGTSFAATGGALAGGSSLAAGSIGAGTGALGAIGAAIPYVGIALAIGAAFGMFGGDGDTTPDLNLRYGTQETNRLFAPNVLNPVGTVVNDYREESNGTFDPSVQVGGRFASIRFGTQHDAFSSKEAADEFINGISTYFLTLEDMVFASFGSDVSQKIADAMGDYDVGSIKIEEFSGAEDFNKMFGAIFDDIFKSISTVTEDADYYATFSKLDGELHNVIAVTLEYAGATGDLKDAYGDLIDRENQNADAVIQQIGALQAVNTIFDSLNISLYETSLAGIDFANNLVEVAGGMEALIAKSDYYYQNFFSELEIVQNTLDSTSAILREFNEVYDTSIYGKRSLRATMEALDLTTESGIELYNALLNLAPTVVTHVDAYNTLNNSINETTDSMEAYSVSMSGLTDDITSFIENIAGVSDNIFSGILDISRQKAGWNETGYQGDVISGLYSDLDGASGVDAVNIIDKLQSHIISRYDAELEAIEATKDAAESAAQARYDAQLEVYGAQKQIYDSQIFALGEIAGYTDNLMASAGALTQSQSLASSRSTFGQTLLKAQSLDADALSGLTGTASDYLSNAMASSSTSLEYNRIVAQVQASLGLVSGLTPNEPVRPSEQAIIDSLDFSNEIAEIQNAAIDELLVLQGDLNIIEQDMQVGFEEKIDELIVVNTELSEEQTAEIALLREELKALSIQQTKATINMSDIIEKWDYDGQPVERVA